MTTLDTTHRTIYRVQFDGAEMGGATTTFTYATRGYTTKPTHDDIPDTALAGCVEQPLLFRRDLYGELRCYGEPELPHGECVLVNAAGDLDTLLGYGFDGQLFQVYRIDDPDDTDIEYLEFEGYMESLTMDLERVTIFVRDITYKLDVPLQSTKYAGTNSGGNGLEGTADDIKGQPKVLSWGPTFNEQGVPVNAGQYIYQAHAGAAGTGWTLEVRVAGVALGVGVARALADFQAAGTVLTVTPDPVTDICTTATHSYATADPITFTSSGTMPGGLADTSTYFARVLSATTFTVHPTAADANANTNVVNITSAGTGTVDVSDNRTAKGCYDWVNDATGFYYRLGSRPTGDVTHDFDNPVSGGATDYYDLLTTLINRSGLSVSQDNQITATYGEVGVCFKDEISIYNACRKVLAAVNGSMQSYVGGPPSNPFSFIVMNRLENPSGSALVELEEKHVLAISREQPRDTERGIPPWRVTVNHTHNGTQQQILDVLDASEADQVFWANEWRKALSADATRLSQYPAAPELFVDTPLVDAGEAEDHADYLLDLWDGAPRSPLRVKVPKSHVQDVLGSVPNSLRGIVLGSVVELTHTRFGLGSGDLFAVIGVETDLKAGTVELILRN